MDTALDPGKLVNDNDVVRGWANNCLDDSSPWFADVPSIFLIDNPLLVMGRLPEVGEAREPRDP